MVLEILAGGDELGEGEKFSYKEGKNYNNIENIVNQLVDISLKENNIYFDSQNILKNRDKYSKFLSAAFNEDEKRIKEDKEYRFNKKLNEGLENLREILIRYGYLDNSGKLSSKALKLYTSKIINSFEKELYGIFEYGKYKSKRLGKDEFFYLKKFGLGDVFREINVKETIKNYIKNRDIKFIAEKKIERKGGNYIILLDVSGSMIDKIYEEKKAVLVLIEKLLEDHNKVYLIIYNDKILFEGEVNNIEDLLNIVYPIYPNGSTDISLALREALKYLNERSHVLLITDALPTYGERPVEMSYEMAKVIRDKNSYLSIFGIKLNKEGIKIGKNLAKIGNGKLYIIKDQKELGKILLLDYYESLYNLG